MKRIICKKMLILFVMTLVLAAFAARTTSAAVNGADSKILIAYFTRTGNTKAVAEHIRELTGGDTFEIKTTKAYPTNYRQCTNVARREQDGDERPALASRVDDAGCYDIIFIGYPIWWGQAPMAVRTFLESYDLSGKTIIPFCTHGGSGLGTSSAVLAALAPGSRFLDGLALRRGSGGQEEISRWLSGLGIDGYMKNTARAL